MKPVNFVKDPQLSSKNQYSSRIFTANPSSTKNSSKLQYSKRGSSTDQARESQRYNANKISPANLITQAIPGSNNVVDVKSIITQAEEGRPHTTFNTKQLIK
jgi:hypothetical protein